jgi:hypothetical protein
MGWPLLALLLGAASGHAKGPASPPSVVVVRAEAWSQGDPVREGAAELAIFMEVARLRQEGANSGLVAVGDRRGLFSAGAEEALHYAVLQGVPVVKLGVGGRVLSAPHGLFLDGGDLSEEAARQLMGRCLEKYGALPLSGSEGVASMPQLRARLELFQREFTLASSARLAAR